MSSRAEDVNCEHVVLTARHDGSYRCVDCDQHPAVRDRPLPLTARFRRWLEKCKAENAENVRLAAEQWAEDMERMGEGWRN